MREATTMLPVLAVCLLYCAGRSLSAPGRSADEVLIGEVDIAMRGYDGGGGAGDGGGGDDDDSPEATTEEPFAKKCIVDDKAYSHSQMIPSKDQSSHCLCVAGEVYCWWQTYGGPASTRTPYESVGAVVVANEELDTWTTEEDDYSGVVGAGAVAEGHSESPEASGDSEAEASGQQQDDNVGNSSDELSDELEEDDEDIEDEDDEEEESNDLPEAPLVAFATNSTTTASVASTARTTMGTSTTMTPHSTRAPATCLVMGRKYQEGEVLPHSTGNCVECSCGAEGRIECSPRDCVGLRPQSPGGDFELFDLERDRGIDGTF